MQDPVTRQYAANGISDPGKLEQEISTACASVFNRSIRPQMWTEIVDGVPLVAAFIPKMAAAQKPVFIASRGMGGGAFRRVGSTDQRCNEDDLRAIFQSASVTSYEDSLVADSTMEDIDVSVLGSYRRSLIDANPATEPMPFT